MQNLHWDSKQRIGYLPIEASFARGMHRVDVFDDFAVFESSGLSNLFWISKGSLTPFLRKDFFDYFPCFRKKFTLPVRYVAVF